MYEHPMYISHIPVYGYGRFMLNWIVWNRAVYTDFALITYNVWWTIKPNQGRCPLCDDYRLRKRTRRHEFKSWTRLIAFQTLHYDRLYFTHRWDPNRSLLVLWRCPWCNGYRRRKWTRWHEFKSWTRLIAFHIALISNYCISHSTKNPIILPPVMGK